MTCKHLPERSTYLTTTYSPHISKPDTLSVATSVFRCLDCGALYAMFIEVSRGYSGDGSIPQVMREEITRIQAKREEDTRVETRVAQLLKERTGGQP